MSLYKSTFWHSTRIRILQPKKQLYTPKKYYCTYLFQSKKREKSFLSKKIIHQYQKKTTKTKQKKISFLLIFLLKLAFKPNKNQESQVPSQDHNQNGENLLKEESILHWASNYLLISYIFNYFIFLFYFFHLVLLFFLCFDLYFVLDLIVIWSYSFLFFFFVFLWDLDWDLDGGCDLKL